MHVSLIDARLFMYTVKNETSVYHQHFVIYIRRRRIMSENVVGHSLSSTIVNKNTSIRISKEVEKENQASLLNQLHSLQNVIYLFVGYMPHTEN